MSLEEGDIGESSADLPATTTDNFESKEDGDDDDDDDDDASSDSSCTSSSEEEEHSAYEKAKRRIHVCYLNYYTAIL